MISVTLPIYLDYNATTPCDPRVFEAMRPYFMEIFGNAASSSHFFGWQAKTAVEDSRRMIAETIGAFPDEIVFTSGATEADNLAVKGAAEAGKSLGKHIITTATEHKAVLDSCKHLHSSGFELSVLPVDSSGFISPAEIAAAIRPDTILVTIMHGNNEIGTVQDIAEIGRICREYGVPFHTDSTQTAGKIPFEVSKLNVDMASLTAHKLYGPKGVGALYVRKGCQILSQMDGGGHESGMRSGTLNVPGIVGFAKAMEISRTDMQRDIAHCRALRDKLWLGIQTLGAEVRLNGPNPLVHPEKRLPGNLNVSFYGDAGELIAGNLNDVAVSAGSACTSASGGFSHVLTALGLTGDNLTSLRFGVGRFSTEEEIDYTLECMRSAL